MFLYIEKGSKHTSPVQTEIRSTLHRNSAIRATNTKFKSRIQNLSHSIKATGAGGKPKIRKKRVAHCRRKGCSQYFDAYQEMLAHMATEHRTKPKGKIHKCHLCPQKFSKAHTLTRHLASGVHDRSPVRASTKDQSGLLSSIKDIRKDEVIPIIDLADDEEQPLTTANTNQSPSLPAQGIVHNNYSITVRIL